MSADKQHPSWGFCGWAGKRVLTELDGDEVTPTEQLSAVHDSSSKEQALTDWSLTATYPRYVSQSTSVLRTDKPIQVRSVWPPPELKIN